MAPSPGDWWLCLCAVLCPAFALLDLAAGAGEPDPWEHCQVIGRHERKTLTRLLNAAWAAGGAAYKEPRNSLWKPSLPAVKLRRRRGRLFEAQRRQWQPLAHRQLWQGWPLRGVRIGEAAHPGPAGSPRNRSASPGRGRRAAEGARIFCPVPSCPCSDPSSARGWASHGNMQAHLNDHCSGSLAGDVPAAYLAQQSLDTCQVCGLLVASRFNGAHPRCRPAARAAAAGAPAQHPGHPPPAPDLAEVFQARAPVLRHVPKAALARALAEAAAHNTIAAWRDLLMLPKAVLRPPPRAGAKRRDQTAQHTLRRCRRWLEGEREELWEAPSRLPRRRRSDEDAAGLTAHQERCKALAAEGELSRACSALVSPPLLGEDEEVSAKLRAKHPQCPPARPGMVPDLPVDQVLAAARSFRRGSAAGPPGCVATTFGRPLAPLTVMRLLPTSLLRLLAAGAAPPELAPHLGGATLHAIPKGDDDVRPIAVGECLRRLVGKCLCQAFKEEAKSALWPLQLGVAVPLGCEAVVHTVRQWAHRNAGHATKVVLKVDFRNAFKTVDRAALLRQLRLRLPGLEWTCDRHSRLLFGDSYISSEAGVQQGDFLGPLLFALALHPALEAARSGLAPPDLVLALLDDVCLAGDYRHVAASLARLTATARQVGLELNPEKCEVVACAGLTTVLTCGSSLPGLRRTRRVRSLCSEHP